jgi:hypothetical protein
LPFGDESAALAVAERYSAKYLVLENTNSLGDLQNLYQDPRGDPAFDYLDEVAGARLYRIAAAPP